MKMKVKKENVSENEWNWKLKCYHYWRSPHDMRIHHLDTTNKIYTSNHHHHHHLLTTLAVFIIAVSPCRPYEDNDVSGGSGSITIPPEICWLWIMIDWELLFAPFARESVGVTSSPLKNIARLNSGRNVSPSKKVKWDDASLCVTPSTHSNRPLYWAPSASE